VRIEDFELPKNIEAEQLIIGAALLNPDEVIPQFGGKIKSGDFYLERHRIIFQTMLELASTDQCSDIVAVANRLDELGKTEQAGGRLYLNELLVRAASASSIDYYADIIRKKAIRRDAIYQATVIADIAQNEVKEIDELTASVDRLSDILDGQDTGGVRTLASYCDATIEHMTDVLQSGFNGISSGLDNIDKLIRGFQPGLYIIGGRPGSGKTTLALDMAYRQSLMKHPHHNRNIIPGILSIEMLAVSLYERLVNRELGRVWEDVPGGNTRANHVSECMMAANRVKKSGIILDERPHVSIQGAAAAAHEMVRKHGVDILYVDYVQLLGDADKTDSREQEIASVMRRFSRLRKQFNIPLVILAQLNRESDKRSDGRPMLSDLRESGSLEAHTDVAMFCHNPPTYGLDGEYELIVAKNRHGPTGTAYLHWLPERFSFEDSTIGIRIPRPGEAHRKSPRKTKKEWGGYDKED
jgi:replicative DNA helicase